MKELIKKIANAKAEIKNTKLKKEGKNTFSNYEYFTPSQIEFLVATACHNNGLLTTFDLIRNELGVFGKLTIFDIETGERMATEMATAIPEIKATNIAQQLGGCVTYTERYLKMSFFGITDNKLDFDTTENTKEMASPQKKNPDELKIALAEMNNCKSRLEMEVCWKKYPQFQKEEMFVNGATAMGKIYPKA